MAQNMTEVMFLLLWCKQTAARVDRWNITATE